MSRDPGTAGVVAGLILGAVVLVLTALALSLVVLNGGDLSNSSTTGSGMLAFSFGVAGAILITRRPTNVIGLILLISGVFSSINAFSAEYPRYALVIDPTESLPAGGALAWMGSWAWAVGAAGFPLILWLFPTGRPTAGWRWLGWLIAGGTALATVPTAIATSGNAAAAIELGRRPDQMVSDLPAQLMWVGAALLGLSLLLALASAITRYRRAHSDERQQLKFLAWAGLLTLIGLVTASPASPFVFQGVWREIFSWVGFLALPSIPAAITLAILRYRLYDIDRIISRTVSYALVVGLLGLIVLALVAGMAVFLRSDDPLVVALATLVVFALFNPLRLRVQRVVDRRFNRSRYDAERIVDEFAASLREPLHPDKVIVDWVDLVSETMQPSSVSAWVRDGT